VTMTVPKLPWFHGDVAGITARLRAAVTPDRPDGDCVQAVMYMEAIAEQPGLSAARRARLTAAVVEAVQLVRGWVSEPSVGEPVPVDVEAEPPAAEQAEDVPTSDLVLAGDATAVAVRLSHVAETRPDGECVEAVRLIEAIHLQGLAPDETVRATNTVLKAVRIVRGWAPFCPAADAPDRQPAVTR
jgi:hypothetical protein